MNHVTYSELHTNSEQQNTVTPSLEVDDTALATPSLTPHCSTSTLSRSSAQPAALSKNRLAFFFIGGVR